MTSFPPLQNDTFLKVLRKEKVNHIPIWLMRQAGRYLPEFREVRKEHSFFEVCETPDLACKVTLQPIDRYAFDASIIFSDILVIPRAMGMEVTMEEKKGPVFADPLREVEDIHKLRLPHEHELDYVYNAITLTRQRLEGRVPLIGFCGSPWTLFVYMCEGQSTKMFIEVKKWIFRNAEASHQVLQMITDILIEYLVSQVKAGAQALQIFDSFAGELNSEYYSTFSFEYIKQITKKLKEKCPETPLIVFAKGQNNQEMIFKDDNTDVVGIDYTQDRLRMKALALQYGKVLQGNMDPGVLLGDKIKEEVAKILNDWINVPFVFNLGHGMWPCHDPQNVEILVKEVHSQSQQLLK